MFSRLRLVALLVLALAPAASCTGGEETVQLFSPPMTRNATASPVADQHTAPTTDTDVTSDEAPAVPSPSEQVGTPPSTPSSPAPALALRTRDPVDGFRLDPPAGFDALAYYPLHGKSMVIDGHRVGIRFFGKHGTGQSVLVAVWSDRAGGAEERLERYQRHTGDVTSGRPVHGATAVRELRERSGPEAPTVTNLSVSMPDGTEIWLSGVDIADVALLYDFLTRIEDAPGSLTPKPD